MRPVRLQLNGFAAFRDEALVDFTDTDFFVLVGATGSGKSTVIDALTFALYGTVPRWNHRSMVMYGLAPTANQGKVALVFDVADERYIVARELRRTKAGVHVRNARLDRLVDPTAVGGIEDEIESVATDSGVTPAIEKLLGLPYEHFCQCVVLPQGEFADFLRAKPAERRTILLRLLGAGLYADIGQRANTRAGQAGVRADLLNQQVADLADATEAAESEAARRAGELASLTERLRDEVPRLRSAATTVAQAQDARERLMAERDALVAIVVPASVAELDAAHTTAEASVARAEAAEELARRVDRDARKRLAAAPDRRPLDQALRDHAELDRVRQAWPDAEADARQTAERLAATIQEAGSAVTALEQARSARDIARAAVADIEGQLTELVGQTRQLAAVVVPDGLADLAARRADAARDAAAAAAAVAAAQDDESAAQDALDTAPARGPLEESLRLARELADAEEAAAPRQREHTEAVESLRAARAALADVERMRDEARVDREHASITHRAAALRAGLVAGQACPVCDHVVDALPAAMDAPELAAAEAALRELDRRMLDARTAESAAAATEAQVAARLAAARQHAAGLAERLDRQPAEIPRDPAALRNALAALDALDNARRAAGARVRAVRADHDRALASTRRADEATAAARATLHRARDPLVRLGAPIPDETDLLAGWTGLADWARQEREARGQRQRALEAALTAAQDSYRRARDTFGASDDRATAAQRAVNAATGAAERATATVDALRTRDGELTKALALAPSAAQAAEQIRLIDEMAAAVADAAAAVDKAVADRLVAQDQLVTLADRVGRAWRELRSARDAVIGLGAPDLPDGSVFAGWTALASWAGAAARSRSAAIPDAQDAVDSAIRRRDGMVHGLTAQFAALGLELAGDPAETAAPIAAAAQAQAAADRTRIAERRARAAALRSDLAAAQQDQQVARELGRLLRSNMFPEWLEAAALDTLVVDAADRLSDLSGGQFELTHRDGEFMVIDHADADSIRSVRTLSGGETFQASLALALALSTQLSSMAAEGAARLDSIFLDEGFGTLDEATLEVVAATLENLAQGDRMVGVVTHVGALADRIPVRFRVRRDSRTSSIERESL